MEDYEEPIHLLLKKYNFKKIFLATDSLEALDFMKKKFGKLLVYYEDVQRSSGEVGNFEVASTRKNHHYLLGLEVLRDAYTLANCDALISGLSAVSLAAHYIKIADGAKYDEAIIIDHGINRVGDKNR